MSTSNSKQNKSSSSKNENWYNFELEEFKTHDEEIARQIAAKEKSRLLAEYELKRLIETQSRSDHYSFHTTNKNFPRSPHVLDIRKQIAIKQQHVELLRQEQQKLEKRQRIIRAIYNLRFLPYIAWQNFKKIFIHHPRQILNRIANTKLDLNFKHIRQLAIIELLYSLGSIIDSLTVVFEKQLIKRRAVSIHKQKFSTQAPKRSILRLLASKYKFSLPKINWLQINLDWVPRISLGKGRAYMLKTGAVFVVVAALMMAPYGIIDLYHQANQTKGRVLGISQAAGDQWQQGLNALASGDWQQAVDTFGEAENSFATAKQELAKYNQLILDIGEYIPGTGKQIQTGRNMILIGQSLSNIITQLSTILQSSQDEQQDMMHKLVMVANKMDAINQEYQRIYPLVEEINLQVLPAQYRMLVYTWQQNNVYIAQWIDQMDENLQWLLDLMGQQQPKRYLLMFQNSNEIRATGGFMGSFALLDLKDGQIQDLSVPGGGTYDLKGQLQEFLISPYPHQLLGARWQMWDVNWWPDWPTTAQKIAWFYEKSGGPTVDGVIAINSDVLTSLVGMFEPIQLPEYDKVLTQENVILALQHAVEFEYDRQENQPKQIIADLAPVLIDNLYNLSAQELPILGNLMNQHLKQKDIQIYMMDEQLQNIPHNNDWDGRVEQTEDDYLQVVVQNIGGGKTDAVVSQQINYDLSVGPDDHLIARTTVTRTHNGDMQDVFQRQRNVAFIRVYAPVGAELIQITGATPPDDKLFKSIPEDYQPDADLIKLDGVNYYQAYDKYYTARQFGKQVFGDWLMLDAGQQKSISFIYRLPISLQSVKGESSWLKMFDLADKKLKYSLHVEPQSGISQQQFNFSFKQPTGSQFVWSGDSLQSLKHVKRGLYSNIELKQDYELGFLMTE